MMNLLLRNQLYLPICFFVFSVMYGSNCSQRPSPQGNVATSSAQQLAAKKILILGNSITRHSPAPELGWTGNWGMAASAEKNDYVHLLMGDINQVAENSQCMYETIAPTFETIFWKYDTLQFKKFKDFNPDVILLRLGDNINDTLAAKYPLRNAIESLVTYLKAGKSVPVFITSTFWPRPVIISILSSTASANGWGYIDISDVQKTRENTAVDSFTNRGVAMHPSDKGMQVIADRIWAVMKPKMN